MTSVKVRIGLETHVRLNSQHKLFCACLNGIARENSNICGVCTGCPGFLPVLSKDCVEMCVPLLCCLGMKLSDRLCFDRKHYVYPDLPKGYQITQEAFPIGTNGYVVIQGHHINITKASLEEDAAKSAIQNGIRKIDYNRSGSPLLEVVTQADFTSSELVISYLNFLRDISASLEIIDKTRSDALRSDVNISLECGNLSTMRTEIKNLNSLSEIKHALNYEIDLHKKMISSGTQQETCTKEWDSEQKKTVEIRKKETKCQYLFTSEFDIPVFNVRFLTEIFSQQRFLQTNAKMLLLSLDPGRRSKLLNILRCKELSAFWSDISKDVKALDVVFDFYQSGTIHHLQRFVKCYGMTQLQEKEFRRQAIEYLLSNSSEKFVPKYGLSAHEKDLLKQIYLDSSGELSSVHPTRTQGFLLSRVASLKKQEKFSGNMKDAREYLSRLLENCQKEK